MRREPGRFHSTLFATRANDNESLGGNGAGLGAFFYFPLCTYMQLALEVLRLLLNPQIAPEGAKALRQRVLFLSFCFHISLSPSLARLHPSQSMYLFFPLSLADGSVIPIFLVCHFSI